MKWGLEGAVGPFASHKAKHGKAMIQREIEKETLYVDAESVLNRKVKSNVPNPRKIRSNRANRKRSFFGILY